MATYRHLSFQNQKVRLKMFGKQTLSLTSRMRGAYFESHFLCSSLSLRYFQRLSSADSSKKLYKMTYKYTDPKSEGGLGVYAENRTYVVVLKTLAVE
jgi:hypothetical protein